MAESKQILAMRKLGMSEEEIQQTLADDKAIDHGQRMDFDLSPEEEKKRKKFINADEHKTTKAKTERKRKENPTKQAIISEIVTFLTEKAEISCENVEIANKEREITFVCGGNDFSIVLTQHRKPKS